MTPVLPEPPPGSMTVPPLFGWENILIVLVLLVVVAVAFFVALAAGTAADSRPEWQDCLDARSRERTAPVADPSEGPAKPLREPDTTARARSLPGVG